MNRNTACAIIGSPSKNKKINKQSRTTRRNYIFSKFHSENPKLSDANSFSKVNQITRALQTITQVCDGSTTISANSAQKSLDNLKKQGLDKYILPPAPVIEAAVQINAAKNIINQKAPNTQEASVVNMASQAINTLANATTPPTSSTAQINTAIANANTAVKNAQEEVTIATVEKKLRNALEALQVLKTKVGGKRKTRKSSK